MTQAITIAEITATDNAAVASLIREVFHEFDAPREGTAYSDPTTDHLFEKFRTPGSVLYLARVGGVLAGCCGIYPTEGLPEGYAELVRFFVAQAFRGTGVGRQLMERSIAFARKTGYRQLYLETIPEFDRAIGIYEKQGFRLLDEPLGDTGHHTCDIWMLKSLQ